MDPSIQHSFQGLASRIITAASHRLKIIGGVIGFTYFMNIGPTFTAVASPQDSLGIEGILGLVTFVKIVQFTVLLGNPNFVIFSKKHWTG